MHKEVALILRYENFFFTVPTIIKAFAVLVFSPMLSKTWSSIAFWEVERCLVLNYCLRLLHRRGRPIQFLTHQQVKHLRSIPRYQ